MKKHYLKECIEKEYQNWNGKKVFISAPTGMGKSTFCEEVLLPYYTGLRKKVCILCNRRALSEQYKNDLIWYYRVKSAMDDEVEIISYQQLAEMIKAGESIGKRLLEFGLIVCDECHYFYQDADFNPSGTYVLLQELIRATFSKTVVFMSATMREVQPLIENCIKRFKEWQTHNVFFQLAEEQGEYFEYICSKDAEKYSEICRYDYSAYASYEHLTPVYYEDEKALLKDIADSDKKTIIFIDDTKMAENWAKILHEKHNVATKDIMQLSSQKLDDSKNSEAIQKMMITRRLSTKILITTSVLDNGFSIHDKEVAKIVIVTESRISFLQMLGRVRTENCDSCELILLKREYGVFKKRAEQFEKMLSDIDKWNGVKCAPTNHIPDIFPLIMSGWYGNDQQAQFLRNMLCIIRNTSNYYSKEYSLVYISKGEYEVSVNMFAKEKIGDMLLEARKHMQLAIDDPIKVAEYQINWLGKSGDELQVEGQQYKEDRIKEFKEKMLTVDGMDKTQFSEFKTYIIKEYHRDLFRDIPAKSSLDNNKFEQICKRYGLKFHKETVDKHIRYYVTDSCTE